ncbi:leucine-rich repeat domain-containing protein [Bacteroidales bacterium OttesenSCG-928-C19]|nr:leucine-rich repeat domain-containing protein [Bacteroidales bacterium OttesenSCG-928-C19]
MEETIEIKAIPSDDFFLDFIARTNKISIDWGDGVNWTVTSNGTPQLYSHRYANKGEVTVTIKAESITLFDMSMRHSTWAILELAFKDCPDLKRIDCCLFNNMHRLEVKGLSALESLNCSYNKITSLDVSECVNLKTLNCVSNELRRLNVSKNRMLEKLNCANNLQINRLNLRNNHALRELDCEGLRLRELDISNNPKLSKLRAAIRGLMSLDISKNFELASFVLDEYTEIRHTNEVESVKYDGYQYSKEAFEKYVEARQSRIN